MHSKEGDLNKFRRYHERGRFQSKDWQLSSFTGITKGARAEKHFFGSEPSDPIFPPTPVCMKHTYDAGEERVFGFSAWKLPFEQVSR